MVVAGDARYGAVMPSWPGEWWQVWRCHSLVCNTLHAWDSRSSGGGRRCQQWVFNTWLGSLLHGSGQMPSTDLYSLAGLVSGGRWRCQL
jgi:hypothetical protein